jgi:hypothetical protein
MSNKILKQDVHEALIKMERTLFDGRDSEDNPNSPVPVRMAWLFAAAYVNNHYPPESEILIRSYKLLQEKGYYYDATN